MPSYQQTDTAGTCTTGAFCSPQGNASTVATSNQATVGGAAGVTAKTVSLALGTTEVNAWINVLDPAHFRTDGGTWVINMNVTTAAARAGTQWTRTFICRVNSSCVNQATIGSLAGQTISLTTTGVKTMTISGVAGFTPSAGDLVVIVFVVQNGSATMTDTFSVTPNQLINTPLQDQWWGGNQSNLSEFVVASLLPRKKVPDYDISAQKPIAAPSISWRFDLTQDSKPLQSLSARVKVPDWQPESQPILTQPSLSSWEPDRPVRPITKLLKHPMPTVGAAGDVVPLTWSWPAEQPVVPLPSLLSRKKVPDWGIEIAPKGAGAVAPNYFDLVQESKPLPRLIGRDPMQGPEAELVSPPAWTWDPDRSVQPPLRRVIGRDPTQGREAWTVSPPIWAWEPDRLVQTKPWLLTRTKVPDLGPELYPILISTAALLYYDFQQPSNVLPSVFQRRKEPYWETQVLQELLFPTPGFDREQLVRPLPPLRKPQLHDFGPTFILPVVSAAALQYVDFVQQMISLKWWRNKHLDIGSGSSAPPAALQYYDFQQMFYKMPTFKIVPAWLHFGGGSSAQASPIAPLESLLYQEWKVPLIRIRTLSDPGPEADLPPTAALVPLNYYDFQQPSTQMFSLRRRPDVTAQADFLLIQKLIPYFEREQPSKKLPGLYPSKMFQMQEQGVTKFPPFVGAGLVYEDFVSVLGKMLATVRGRIDPRFGLDAIIAVPLVVGSILQILFETLRAADVTSDKLVESDSGTETVEQSDTTGSGLVP